MHVALSFEHENRVENEAAEIEVVRVKERNFAELFFAKI